MLLSKSHFMPSFSEAHLTLLNCTTLFFSFLFCSLCQFTFSLFILQPAGILIFRTLPLFFVTLIILSVFLLLMLSKLKSNYDSCTLERNYFQHILFLLSLLPSQLSLTSIERRLLLSFLQFHSGNKRRIASSPSCSKTC